MAVSEAVPSRAEFESLVPWAKKFYAKGFRRPQVIAAIYGVDLPEEIYTFHSRWTSGMRLPLTRLVHPWALLAVSDPAVLPHIDNPWARRQEENSFVLDPGFIGLMELGEEDAKYGGHLLGYHLDELRHGKTTVLGHRGEIPRQGITFQPIGQSLFGVLHKWAASNYQGVREEFSAPHNIGFGAAREEHVKHALENLRIVENLLREAGVPFEVLPDPDEDWPD